MNEIEQDKEIRRLNLARITESYASQKAFADKLDQTPGYINQLLTGRRPIGEKSARSIEKKLGLDKYYLDKNHITSDSLSISYAGPNPLDAIPSHKLIASGLVKEEIVTWLPVIPWHKLSMFLSGGSNLEGLETMAINQEFSKNAFFVRAENNALAPYLKNGELALVEPMENTLGQRVLVEMNGQFHIMEHNLLAQECFLPVREGVRQIDITESLQYTIHGVIKKILAEREG